jgi:hypothetical protein
MADQTGQHNHCYPDSCTPDLHDEQEIVSFRKKVVHRRLPVAILATLETLLVPSAVDEQNHHRTDEQPESDSESERELHR